MPRLFSLTAIPQSLPVVPDKKHLEYIKFLATNGSTTIQWWSKNVGNYAKEFALFVDAGSAFDIINRLYRGETVAFPGHWTHAELSALGLGLPKKVDSDNRPANSGDYLLAGADRG